MSYQLKNKSKANSQDWILRFKIDSEKAEKEYFGYYPEMHPDNPNLKISDRDETFMYTLYCLMSDDIKNKVFALKSTNITFLEVFLRNTPEHKITEQERAQIAKMYLGERELLDVITGLKHFESLGEEAQYELVKNHSFLSKNAQAVLAVHHNEKVATTVSEKIINGKDPALLEVLNYNHGRGVVTVSRETLVDNFVKDFIRGKNPSCSLSLIKKNAKKLKEEITKDAELFKLSYGDNARRYGLNILASKDLEGAKALLKKMEQPYDLAGVRQIGETLLIEPEAKLFRERIYKVGFKERRYGNSSSWPSDIPENQIKSFARIFALIEKANPNEWKELCNQIATNEHYMSFLAKRDKYIHELKNGYLHDDSLWFKMQPFNPHFVRTILLSHLMYGLPLHNAKFPLLTTLNEYLLDKIFAIKELYGHHVILDTLKSLQNDKTSPEMAFQVYQDFMNTHHQPVITDEIDIIIDF